LAYRIAMTVCSLSPAGSNRSFRRRPFRLSSSARRSARPRATATFGRAVPTSDVLMERACSHASRA
jgi:hypothetical protein